MLAIVVVLYRFTCCCDIMEKLVDKKQTVLDFMKAVNLLVKMKSGFTVF